MMNASVVERLEARVARLEATNRFYRGIVLAITVLGGAYAAWSPAVAAQGSAIATPGNAIAAPGNAVAAQGGAALRVRELIVEDAQGRPRIVLQAPLADGPSSQRTGIRINDVAGVERIGLAVVDNGTAVIGIDAPRGTGDDRNRERITLTADGSGGAALTFKDRRTSVAARMLLTPDNQVWLQFSDFMRTPPVLRRIGLGIDQTIENPQ